MAPARKVFTEAMIRRTLTKHFEIEPTTPGSALACECGWETQLVSPNSGGVYIKEFEDHFIDQLHKLWHEMFSRTKSTPTNPNTIVESVA